MESSSTTVVKDVRGHTFLEHSVYRDRHGWVHVHDTLSDTTVGFDKTLSRRFHFSFPVDDTTATSATRSVPGQRLGPSGTIVVMSKSTKLEDTKRTYSIFWRIRTYANIFYFSVRVSSSHASPNSDTIIYIATESFWLPGCEAAASESGFMQRACPSVCLFVSLFACRQNAKKRDFLKN